MRSLIKNGWDLKIYDTQQSNYSSWWQIIKIEQTMLSGTLADSWDLHTISQKKMNSQANTQPFPTSFRVIMLQAPHSTHKHAECTSTNCMPTCRDRYPPVRWDHDLWWHRRGESMIPQGKETIPFFWWPVGFWCDMANIGETSSRTTSLHSSILNFNKGLAEHLRSAMIANATETVQCLVLSKKNIQNKIRL